ncbi:hypothetical protein CR513_39191, partial [Mucuna pruriens]
MDGVKYKRSSKSRPSLKNTVVVGFSRIIKHQGEVKKVIKGSIKEQYDRIWEYMNELIRSNLGLKIKIDNIFVLKAPPLFQMFFICLDGCKKDFKARCRSFIGCFLKGYYGGQFMSTIDQDIYIIAYAIFDVENKDKFDPAVKEVMPGIDHMYCVMHLWRNFTKHGKIKIYRLLITLVEFKFNIKIVKRIKKNIRHKHVFSSGLQMHALRPTSMNIQRCIIFETIHVRCLIKKNLKYRSKPILSLAEEI